MTLIDRLLRLAEIWAAASSRSTARLATVVANDGKLFERLGGGATCTVATFERFFDHLQQPTNWPSSGIPTEARELLASLDVRAADHGQVVSAEGAFTKTGTPENLAGATGSAAEAL